MLIHSIATQFGVQRGRIATAQASEEYADLSRLSYRSAKEDLSLSLSLSLCS